MRVLVADDEADVRALVALRLEAAGYEVLTAPDGARALGLALAALPDLAVLDVMMPELDGFALTRALRADPRTSEMPVLILSARAGRADEQYALRVGADDYLLKPFRAPDLLDRVRALDPG